MAALVRTRGRGVRQLLVDEQVNQNKSGRQFRYSMDVTT